MNPFFLDKDQGEKQKYVEHADVSIDGDQLLLHMLKFYSKLMYIF